MGDGHIRIKKELNETGGTDTFMYFTKNRDGYTNHSLYYSFDGNSIQFDEERYFKMKDALECEESNLDDYDDQDDVVEEHKFTEEENSAEDNEVEVEIDLEFQGDTEFSDGEPIY